MTALASHILNDLAAHHPVLALHCQRVAALASVLAGEDLWDTVLVHDAGKLFISPQILLKPGPLDTNEWKAMREHPLWGAALLENLCAPADWVQGAKCHHERWDGTGYPLGLAGTDIPWIARVIHVADAYDAMATRRCYRQAMPRSEALEEISRCAGTQFDPEIAARFNAIMDPWTYHGEFAIAATEAWAFAS